MKTACVLVLLAMVLGTCYAGIPFKVCDSMTDINVIEVTVFNSTGWVCKGEPCPVVRGQNISVTIAFKEIGADVDSLNNSVYGIFEGITVPYPNYPEDMKVVCKLASDASSHCPIKKGDKFTEKVTLPVIKEAPSGLNVVAKWEFKDPDGKEVGCFEVKLKIV